MKSIHHKAIALAGLTVVMAVPCFVSSAGAQHQAWLEQFGTPEWDRALALASDDAGGVYCGGDTRGSLMGPSFGGSDGFLARYSHRGEQIWAKQIGTNVSDAVRALLPDGHGGVYAAGYTGGDLFSPSVGGSDAFVVRFDKDGNTIWMRQFGSTDTEWIRALAPGGLGGVYAAGHTAGDLGTSGAGTYDAFVTHFDQEGNQFWIHQFGTKQEDVAYAAAPDGVGGVYVAGRSGGSLGGTNAGYDDAFIARFNLAGGKTWIRQFGTSSDDWALALLAMGEGEVIVGGFTGGDLAGPSAGSRDAYISRYNSQGDRIWIRQFGTVESDRIYALAPDGSGGFFAAGDTAGRMSGSGRNSLDGFLAHFDGLGRLLDVQQFGGRFNDEIDALASDGVGGVFVAGGTEGFVIGTGVGPKDAFIGRFVETYCYADCDRNGGWGTLNIFDFLCFQNSFVNGESYACDCDTSTGVGVCNMLDFLCFQNAFVAGCP